LATAKIIDVTPLAAQKLAAVLTEQGQSGSFLRVMVMPNGAGYQHVLGIEDEAKTDDFVFEMDGIKVLVAAEDAPLVEGAQIDYIDGLMRSGFVISNPNVQAGGGGCACGGGGCGGGMAEAAEATEARAGGCACGREGGCGGHGGGGGGCACGGHGGGHSGHGH